LPVIKLPVGRSEATRVKRTSRKGTLAHFYVAVVKPPSITAPT
jgi:hypothetical protein